MAAPLSLAAQAQTVESLLRALPGCKAFLPREAELIEQRAAIVVKTLKLFAQHEDAIREMLKVRMHIESSEPQTK